MPGDYNFEDEHIRVFLRGRERYLSANPDSRPSSPIAPDVQADMADMQLAIAMSLQSAQDVNGQASAFLPLCSLPRATLLACMHS